MNDPDATHDGSAEGLEAPASREVAPLARSTGGRVRGVLKIVAVILAVGLLVVLTLQNTDDISLNLLAWTVTLSAALLVFALIVAGVLIGWVLRSMRDDDGFRPLG
ncbi:MAG: LapA family protein [Chloroflexi bacterium]|nr:LapA family protein [Chloroflexota bacterium]